MTLRSCLSSCSCILDLVELASLHIIDVAIDWDSGVNHGMFTDTLYVVYNATRQVSEGVPLGKLALAAAF